MTTMYMTDEMLPKAMHWPADSVQAGAALSKSNRNLSDSDRTSAQDISIPLHRDPTREPSWLFYETLGTTGGIAIRRNSSLYFVGTIHQGMSPVDSTRLVLPPRRRALLEARHAAGEEELIHLLEVGGFPKTAKRIRYLSRVHKIDTEEVPIRLDSLRFCTLFVLADYKLPIPEIGLGYDGLLSAEWSAPKFGTVAIVFLLDGTVRFAASSLSHKPARRVGGTLPPELAVKAVESFIPRQEND